MATRRKGARRVDKDTPQLNLIPILNLVLMLIPAILISAAFVEMVVINVSAPQLPSTNAPVIKETRALNLTLLLTERGIIISGDGQTLSRAAEPGASGSGLTVPKDGAGGYDWPALRRRLVSIKDSFPEEERVVIRAEPDVPYEQIVDAMDTARETPDKRLLFPEVVLSPGIS